MELQSAGRWTVSEAETRAMRKAIHANGAALVERVQYGTYLVPSASAEGERYVVTGTSIWARELRCTCPAGSRGHPCWHRASVQLRRAQESAKAQARKLAARQQPAPAAPTAIRQSVGTIRVGGVEFIAEGRNVLDAIARAAERAHAAGQQRAA